MVFCGTTTATTPAAGDGVRQNTGEGHAAACGCHAAARDPSRVPRAESRHRDRRQPDRLAHRVQRHSRGLKIGRTAGRSRDSLTCGAASSVTEMLIRVD